jgi:hypothetical protein
MGRCEAVVLAMFAHGRYKELIDSAIICDSRSEIDTSSNPSPSHCLREETCGKNIIEYPAYPVLRREREGGSAHGENHMLESECFLSLPRTFVAPALAAVAVVFPTKREERGIVRALRSFFCTTQIALLGEPWGRWSPHRRGT